MILGRPTNMWIGLTTAAAALIQVLIITLAPEVNPVSVATVLGSVTAFLGVFIAFVAGQPPTLNPGDTINVTTPAGAPNDTRTV